MAHGKGARARSKMKRMAAKRAMKAARQANWEALRGTAKNKKKKVGGGGGIVSVASNRVLMAVRRDIHSDVIVERMVHGGAECGNIGCKRCSPIWKIS